VAFAVNVLLMALVVLGEWELLPLRTHWWLAPALAPLAVVNTWVIARWSPFGDRRLRGQCPACGYDLRATPERCPECGRATRRTRGAATPTVPDGVLPPGGPPLPSPMYSSGQRPQVPPVA
jgi:hypothetical protein